MCVIQLQLQDTSKLFIVGVYMPHQNCKISNFRYEMDTLAELIGELSATGNVLLIGDTNCHFGPEHGPRGWGRTTANGRAFIDVMYKCGMVMIDLDDKTSGPTYTYCFRKGRSYIDNCAITCDAFYAIRSCKVLADEIRNVSDHLAITAELQLSHIQAAQPNETRNTFKFDWHKATPEEIRECYTLPLEVNMRKLLDDHGISPQVILEDQTDNGQNDNIDVDKFVQQFCRYVLNASSNLPKVKYNKALKPYWNDQLTNLSKQQKAAWKAWVSEGRPRDPSNPYFTKYKHAKRNFRNMQRACTLEYEKQCMNELVNSQEVDQRYFWYCVYKNKRAGKTISPILDESGNLLTDINDIRKEWNSYYAELYAFRDNSDKEFASFVNKEVELIDNQVSETADSVQH